VDKAAELIDAGLFELATAVAGPKETGVPVVPFQGGHGGGDENALDLLPLDAGRTNRPVKDSEFGSVLAVTHHCSVIG